MKGNVINLNTLHLNSVRLNGIGKVQSVSLKGGSTEDPVFPPVEPPIEPEPTPTYTLSASVTNGKVSATLNGSAVNLPFTANEGDVIVVEVTPNDGYTFEGWNDGNTDNPRSITMTADVVLSAECVEVVQPPVGNYIQFEDAEVERVLMSKGVSSDGVGITMEDAAKVTNMQGWFKNNTAIRTFNELQYFTGLTTLSQDIFFGSSLEAVTFPATMTAFGNYCFYQLAGMDTLEIPATITTIGTYLLSDSSIVKVIMRATTPPAIAGYTFRFHRGAVSIYVPDASLEAYKTATNWVDMAAYIHPLSEIEGSLVFYDKLVGDGTAYINTEYYAKGTDGFAWSADRPTNWNKFIFGCKSSALNLGVLPINESQTYYLVGSAGATAVTEDNRPTITRELIVTQIDGSLHRVLTDNGEQTKDFGAVGSYADKTSSAPLLLFSCQTNATNATADRIYNGTIRSFSITDIDGNTIMSLKPCTFAGDAGMWDEVNGKFYGNAATSGEFSVAND